MIAKIGSALSKVFSKTAPDPFVIAVGLTVLTAVLAVTVGYSDQGGAELTIADRSKLMIDSWRGGDGLWKFLAFGMQMCLILVTGHALAASKPMRGLIDALARVPKNAASGAAMVGFFAMVFGFVNWGVGLIVGALLAREVARSMRARGIRAHGPLLASAGYMGLLIWHGGLSGSAPLKMTSKAEAESVLPSSVVESLTVDGIFEGVSLSQTVFSPMNLFVSGGLLVIVPLVLWLLTPKADPAGDDEIVEMPMSSDPVMADIDDGRLKGFPDWIERSPIVVWVLAAMLLAAYWRFADQSGVLRMGPNEINMVMLALGLILHGSVRSYVSAAEDGAAGCAGIILQFPLYAGIMGMGVSSGLVEDFSQWIGSFANETTGPLLTFVSAGVVNLFVPSGGGQWGIQGPIALSMGGEVGVPAGKMIMAVAYGDQLTNMLQPFWALPLLAITRVKAREIVGYTAVVMVVAGGWMAVGLLVF
ncbi:MAG: short-chain fatty acid transporter [Phycisphaerales bacterium]|nr:short-chain fatty acid transporter [Phycisphaerales bacterium]